MKRSIINVCILSAVFMGCTSNEKKTGDNTVMTTDTATTTKMDENATPVDSMTMIKNWQSYSTPGDVHKMMASWDGTWSGKVLQWHKSGMAPDSSTGISVNKMIMGGRYQQSNFSGNMMGMPFEGISTMGYDNAKKKFVSSWVDNMGTGIMNMEGTWDDATKSMTMQGKMVDPSRADGHEIVAREVFRIMDDKHQVMEMYGPGEDGKEFKWMEIQYTKK